MNISFRQCSDLLNPINWPISIFFIVTTALAEFVYDTLIQRYWFFLSYPGNQVIQQERLAGIKLIET